MKGDMRAVAFGLCLAVAGAAFGAASPPASAHEATGSPGHVAQAPISEEIMAAENSDDAAIERKVRAVALAVGNAYVCTDEAARAQFREEAHHLFDLIVQDVGSDLGFAYATTVGVGSTQPRSTLDCGALLAQWEALREDYELKAEDQ